VSPIILPYLDRRPQIDPAAWVAPGAAVIGDVRLGPRVTVWFGCVLRGDVAPIIVGENTNIQDGTVVHVSTGKPPTQIGANVTIGHMALIHSCVLEDGSFVGMKACISDGAVVESGAMVAAGALVTPGKRVRTGELWGGSPARFMRALTDADLAYIARLPDRYSAHIGEYRDGIPAAHR
jgi:carbonic anhydrase/acetyltransferase-like protein (isoleucine patch superfamily)